MQTRVLKRHLLASVGLVSLTVASSAASAADITLLQRPPAAIWSWSGLYIGGHVGYGWGRDPFTDVIFGGKAPLLSRDQFQRPGLGLPSRRQLASRCLGRRTGNRPLGHEHQRVIVGFVDPHRRRCNRQYNHHADRQIRPARVGSCPARISRVAGRAALRHRRPRLDPVCPELRTRGSCRRPAASITASFSDSDPSWRFGAVVGAGVEARLWDSNWLARLEYLHYDFGDSGSSSVHRRRLLHQRPSDRGRGPHRPELQVRTSHGGVCRPCQGGDAGQSSAGRRGGLELERLLPRRPCRLRMGTRPV